MSFDRCAGGIGFVAISFRLTSVCPGDHDSSESPARRELRNFISAIARSTSGGSLEPVALAPGERYRKRVARPAFRTPLFPGGRGARLLTPLSPWGRGAGGDGAR